MKDRRRAVAGRHCAAVALLLSLGGIVLSVAANPIIIAEAGRGPYAIVRETINVTVGRTVSQVVGDYEYLYVRAYDSKDHLDPVLIDVPVIVRAEDIEPAKVLKLARVQVTIGRNVYAPRDVLLLDHEAYEPVPWLPDGARIAMVAFSIPRQGLKPRFRARISYDQPHVTAADGAELSTYLPLLPDYDQLQEVVHFKPGDFVVTFTALPDVSLRHDSVNAHVEKASPEIITLHPRNRETMAVAVVAR